MSYLANWLLRQVIAGPKLLGMHQTQTSICLTLKMMGSLRIQTKKWRRRLSHPHLPRFRKLQMAKSKETEGATSESCHRMNAALIFAVSSKRKLLCVLFFLAVMFALMRSRFGAAVQAIRDDEHAAASVGVRVMAAKRLIFTIAAFGCAAAGTLWLATALTFQPRSWARI